MGLLCCYLGDDLIGGFSFFETAEKLFACSVKDWCWMIS